MPVGEAKAPVFAIVGGPVRDPVRRLGQRVKMPPQLGERDDCVDRRAVLHDMQVVGCEIDDPRAVEPVDMGGADVPFSRHDPVQDRGAGRDFADLQWNVPAQHREAAPQSGAGNAAANREERPDEAHHRLARACLVALRQGSALQRHGKLCHGARRDRDRMHSTRNFSKWFRLTGVAKSLSGVCQSGV